MQPRSSAGISAVEIVVILGVLFILILLAVPLVSTSLVRDGHPQVISNMKQLHLATQQMALDGTTTENTNIGWPGDIGGTFSNWTAQHLDGHYLSKEDLCKLLSAPGIVVSKENPFITNKTALLLYNVSENSDGEVVFLTTANFTNTPTGGILDTNAKPYGNKGFAVFRKAGDGAMLRPRQVGLTNIIGSFVPLCH